MKHQVGGSIPSASSNCVFMAHLLLFKAATINVAVLKFDEFWDFEYNINRKMKSLSIVLLFDNINFNRLKTVEDEHCSASTVFSLYTLKK